MKKILALAVLLCTATISQAVINITTAVIYATNTTVAGDIHIFPGGSLTVPSGVTLTINGGTVEKGIIKVFTETNPTSTLDGGRLFVDGTITSSATALPTWKGIYVVGDNTLSQQDPKMAKATFTNATISKAETGVTNYDRQNDFSATLTGGGIIEADNSQFNNNGHGVYMRHYQNYDPSLPSILLQDYSYFKQCSFDRTNAYITHFGQDVIEMRLDEVSGILVQACYFDCSATLGNVLPTTGIYLESAGAIVTQICTPSPSAPPGTPCTGGIQTRFNRLEKGIVGLAPFTGPQFKVESSLFQNCMHGIFLTGYQNSVIVHNRMEIATDFTNRFSGIALEGCTGFVVEGNTIDAKNNASGGQVFGIEITDAGGLPNTVYNNYLIRNNFALENNGDSKDPTFQTGLTFLCNNMNTHISDAYDIVITPTGLGIAPIQASFISGGLFSADNLFNAYTPGSVDQNISNGGDLFEYYYDPAVFQTDPVASTNIIKVASSTSYCFSRYGVGTPNAMSRSSYGNEKASLESRIASGSRIDSVALMGEYRQLNNLMIQNYLGLYDSLGRMNIDSVISILDNAHFSNEYQVMKAGYQLQLGRYANAAITLNALAVNNTLSTVQHGRITDMLSLISLATTMKGLIVNDKTGNLAVTFSELDNIEMNGTYFAKAMARYLKSVYYNVRFEPNLIPISGFGRKNSNNTLSIANKTASSIQLVPNPASSEFRLLGLSESASVSIIDMTGRTNKTIKLRKGETVVNITTLAAGSYVVTVKLTSGIVTNYNLIKQ